MTRFIRNDPPSAVAALVLLLTLGALPIVASWPL